MAAGMRKKGRMPALGPRQSFSSLPGEFILYPLSFSDVNHVHTELYFFYFSHAAR